MKQSTAANFSMMAISLPQAIHDAMGKGCLVMFRNLLSHLISGRPRLRAGRISVENNQEGRHDNN